MHGLKEFTNFSDIVLKKWKCSCCQQVIEYEELEDILLKECPKCKATLLTVKEYRTAKSTAKLNELTYMHLDSKKRN